MLSTSDELSRAEFKLCLRAVGSRHEIVLDKDLSRIRKQYEQIRMGITIYITSKSSAKSGTSKPGSHTELTVRE